MTVKRRTASDRKVIVETKAAVPSAKMAEPPPKSAPPRSAKPPKAPSPPGVEDISKKGQVFDEFETGVILKLALSHGMAKRLRAVLAQEIKLRADAASSHVIGPNEMFARLLDTGIQHYANTFEKRAARILKQPLPVKPAKPRTPGEQRRLVASREEAAAQLAQIIAISAALDAGEIEPARALVQRTLSRRRVHVQALDARLAKDAPPSLEVP